MIMRFQRCPVCSRWFDMRDLAQVAEHIHDGARLRFWKDRDRRPVKCLCTKQKAAGVNRRGSAARRRR
jgi:hypothetical protein